MKVRNSLFFQAVIKGTHYKNGFSQLVLSNILLYLHYRFLRFIALLILCPFSIGEKLSNYFHSTRWTIVRVAFPSKSLPNDSSSE